jgi:putative methionine-R-sulfoxide reductase with GAF domain
MILRYEILAYLLTLIAALVSGGAIMALPPEGWITVLAVLGVLGLLTKRILEEAITAEELNKIALRERIITSNLTLGDAFTQLEQLANRVLDWGDFRIYRLREEQPVLVYRGALGWEGRGDPPFDSAALRAIAIRTGEPVVVVDSRQDERIMAPSAAALSMMVLPLRFGNETIGTFEVDHHKTRTYGKKEIAAASTFAAQLATAIHIADLRRPLVETVEGLGEQIRALAATAEALRGAAAATAAAAQQIRGGVAEQEQLVARGLEATESLSSQAREVAEHGGAAVTVSDLAANVATRNRESIQDAIQRLVQLHSFVSVTTGQVGELYQVTNRLIGFIATIRESPTLPTSSPSTLRSRRPAPGNRGRASPSSPKRCDSSRPRAVKRHVKPADWSRRSWPRSPRFPKRWIAGRRRFAALSTCRPTRRRRWRISSAPPMMPEPMRAASRIQRAGRSRA